MTDNSIPRFRYLDDVTRFVTRMDTEITELGQVMAHQQRLLANTPKPLLTAAKLKDGAGSKVAALVSKLDPQYKTAAALYSKHRQLQAVAATLSLSFGDRQLGAATASLAALNNKTDAMMCKCLQFLGATAETQVPPVFSKFVTQIAESIEAHAVCESISKYLYVHSDGDAVVFTAYLMLNNVVNDEGRTEPHIYISLQWVMGSSLYIELNHEFELPQNLVNGVPVKSVATAVSEISTLLEAENFSSGLGVAPIGGNVTEGPISYRDHLVKATVNDNQLMFVLTKATPVVANECAAQIYRELKTVLQPVGLKLSLKASATSLAFTATPTAGVGTLSAYDMEYLRDRFSYDTKNLRKLSQLTERP